MIYSIIVFIIGIFILFLLSESVRKERNLNESKRSRKSKGTTGRKKGTI